MRFCITFILLLFLSCESSKQKKMETKTNKPIICDVEIGACETPSTNSSTSENTLKNNSKKIKVIYYTDPICSSCWGIEPQLRKLKLAYGHTLDIEYKMGGLLPDWSYNSGGISKPSDVAHHWDEVSQYYQMPIDGDIWLENPLDSSYPSSIAFKAAQIQDEKKAVIFLRKLRELLFLQKKNITEWKYVELASNYAKLNTIQLKKEYQGIAKTLFQKDLELSKQLGVRGFPTLFFVGDNKTEIVYGFKPYSTFEKAIQKINPNIKAKPFSTTISDLFAKYPTLTVKEYSVLTDIDMQKAKTHLEDLIVQNKATKISTKNGDLYVSK